MLFAAFICDLILNDTEFSTKHSPRGVEIEVCKFLVMAQLTKFECYYLDIVDGTYVSLSISIYLGTLNFRYFDNQSHFMQDTLARVRNRLKD